MKLTHLNALRAFESTLRNGSFTAAGREIGVTPAAVGQQIRSLEEYLGYKLFLRSTKGVTPTKIAQKVSGHLTTGFSEIDRVLTRLRHDDTANRISITLPPSFAENWFTARIAEFYRTNTELDLRLDASYQMVDLFTEDFDFAIRYCAEPSDLYEQNILFGDFVLPVCSPNFLLKYGILESQKSLIGIPLIHLDNRTPDPEWADWKQWGTTFGIDPNHLDSGIRITKLSSGLKAAVSGEGLVLCGITEAYNGLVSGELVAPFRSSRCCPTSYKYRLVSIKDRGLSSLHQRFRNWVLEISAEFENSVLMLISP